MDQISVDGHEDVELRSRRPQEFTVQLSGPAILANVANLERRNLAPEPGRHALVQQYSTGFSHAARPRSASVASSRNWMACSRRTPGKSAKNSSSESPASR